MKSASIFDSNLAKLHFARFYNADNALIKEISASLTERISILKKNYGGVLVCNHRDFPKTDLAIKRLHTVDLSNPDDKEVLFNDYYDLIFSFFSLHLANDPVIVMKNYLKALREKGVLLAVVFGGQTLKELRQAILKVDMEVFHGAFPRIYPMIDLKDIAMLALKAGFKTPVSDSDIYTYTFSDVRELINFSRSLGYSNCLTMRQKQILPKDYFEKLNQIYLKNFSYAGKLVASFEIVTLTAFN